MGTMVYRSRASNIDYTKVGFRDAGEKFGLDMVYQSDKEGLLPLDIIMDDVQFKDIKAQGDTPLLVPTSASLLAN